MILLNIYQSSCNLADNKGRERKREEGYLKQNVAVMGGTIYNIKRALRLRLRLKLSFCFVVLVVVLLFVSFVVLGKI